MQSEWKYVYEDASEWQHTTEQCFEPIREKVRQLQGDGNSLITLVLTADSSITSTQKMLDDEMAIAATIKSRINRLTKLSALSTAKSILGVYQSIPKNGLMIMCGNALTVEGRIKVVKLAIVQSHPVMVSDFRMDKRFWC